MEYGAVILLALLVTIALSHDVRYFAAQMNADTLWQSQYLWDLGHMQGALQNFQIAEVGNQIPDLALGWAFSHLLPSWRQIAFAMMLAHFLLYTFSGALLVVAMVRTSFARAALGTAGVLAAIVMLDVLLRDAVAPAAWGASLHYPQLFPISTLFVTGTHSGAYPLGLCAAAVAARGLRGRRLWLWLPVTFALIACAVLSDREVLVEIVVPLLLALAVIGGIRAAREGWRFGAIPLLYIGAAAVASAGALVAQRAMHAIADPVVASPVAVIGRIPPVLAAFYGFARAHANLAAAPFFLCLVFLAAPYAFARASAATPEQRERRWLLWTFALFSLLSSFAFFVALFVDLDALRYVEPALFVIVPFVVALALQKERFADVPGALAVVAGAAAIGALIRAHSVLPGQLAWRAPYASCIAVLRDRYGSDAGIADYWIARPETLSSDFSVQVDPVRPDGSEMDYMNDATWFRHSIVDPSRPPRYRFVIMRGLDQGAVTSRFGQPDHSVECDGGPIFIYDDSNRLQRAIAVPH